MASEAGQGTQNSQDIFCHFRYGATRENRTIFAISGWLVKKFSHFRSATFWMNIFFFSCVNNKIQNKS